MKISKSKIICLVLLLLTVSCAKRPRQLMVEVMNAYTPVKQQAGSETCWVYAMLAAIETEHIMRGDSVHLSVAFAERHIASLPGVPSSRRGVAMTLVNIIQRFGIVPYGAFPGDDPDQPLPRNAYMHGVSYTLLEFAHSVCAPGEWVGLGCDSSKPYYEEYVFDSPDNWEGIRLLNVPVDTLAALTERAVRQGHGVCWEGDTSEPGFLFKEGLAVASLFSGSTTDDHCMAIVGIGRDERGHIYYIMKNSWGTANPYGGLVFMSEEYFRSKTLAVFMVRDAIDGG